jgi:hypothetical protein
MRTGSQKKVVVRRHAGEGSRRQGEQQTEGVFYIHYSSEVGGITRNTLRV